MKDLPGQVVATGRMGWYFRVLEVGVVWPSVPMTLVERPFPAWKIERANRGMHTDRDDRRSAAELAAVPPHSASWREALAGRVDRG